MSQIARNIERKETRNFRKSCIKRISECSAFVRRWSDLMLDNF